MTPIDALRALLACFDPKQMMTHEQQLAYFAAKQIVDAALVEHEHSWYPIPGETARYLCDCGQTGYRSKSGITPHKHDPRISKRWTATGHTRGVGGQVRRKPGAL